MKRYFEVCKKGLFNPVEILVEKMDHDVSKIQIGDRLTAKRVSADSFEIEAKYITGLKSKKFVLNTCAMDDMILLKKILEDVEPGWKTFSMIIKGEEI